MSYSFSFVWGVVLPQVYENKNLSARSDCVHTDLLLRSARTPGSGRSANTESPDSR